VDEDVRTRDLRADDDGPDPVLHDEALPRDEPDAHDLAPDDSVEHLLRDEAAARPSDQGRIEPDASAEADLLDAAPGEPGDAPPDAERAGERARTPAPPPPRFTGAWREPVLPERRFARRSARDELMADPAPAEAALAPPKPARPSGLLIKVTPRSEAEPSPYDAAPLADAADALPPEVRARVLDARAAQAASMAAAVAREDRRARTIALTMGLLGLLAGGVSGLLMLATAGAVVAAALADALLAAGAGLSTYRLGGGSVRGLASFGLAAIVSAAIKVALGAITLTGIADLAAFGLLVTLTLSVTLFGGFLGQRIDAWTFEDGT
jgi:hypothetical protein